MLNTSDIWPVKNTIYLPYFGLGSRKSGVENTETAFTLGLGGGFVGLGFFFVCFALVYFVVVVFFSLCVPVYFRPVS